MAINDVNLGKGTICFRNVMFYDSYEDFKDLHNDGGDI